MPGDWRRSAFSKLYLRCEEQLERLGWLSHAGVHFGVALVPLSGWGPESMPDRPVGVPSTGGAHSPWHCLEVDGT